MVQIDSIKKFMTGGLSFVYRNGERVFKPIDEVEIIKETEKSITIADLFGGPYCYHKRLQSYQFHDTFEEAQEYLMQKAKEDIAALTAALHDADETLAKIQALRAS